MSDTKKPDMAMATIVTDLLMICITLATISAAQSKGADGKFIADKLIEIDRQLQDAMAGITEYVNRG